MVQKEVASLWELRQVGGSFSAVMEEADRFQDKLRDLDASFANISETTEQFLCVKSDISDSVSEAQNAMEALGQTSVQVQSSYDAMPSCSPLSRRFSSAWARSWLLRTRPIFWPSTPPLRRRGPAQPDGASPWWPTR